MYEIRSERVLEVIDFRMDIILVLSTLGFELSVVNVSLFPIDLMMGADFTLYQYIVWNDIPTALHSLIGSLTLVRLVFSDMPNNYRFFEGNAFGHTDMTYVAKSIRFMTMQ